jgi:hypothetical protein
MRMPSAYAPAPVQGDPRFNRRSATAGISPQGCNVFEWAGCAAAIAGCAALSGPALIACVAAAAPGCVKCL